MWKPTKNKEEIKTLYENIKAIYGDKRLYGYRFSNLFDDLFFEIIEEKGLEERARFMPTELMELYSELDIVPKEDNPYIAHLDNISRIFGINKNILEIGGGAIPALSNIISKRQLEIGTGTITMIDPNLLTTKAKSSNLKLYKERFDTLVNPEQFDLLVGIMCCGVTDKLLASAAEYNKDFYIAMCGCTGDRLDYNMNFIPEYKILVPYAKRLCEEYNMGELMVEYLDSKYDIPYPIIYNKRK